MLTTKIQNPHFLPETCIKLTVVNFSITFEGLEEQMLADVIKNEEPEVEEQRDSLIIELATSRNGLINLRRKILNELAASNSETILDNVVLIETLEICKTQSVKILESLYEAEQVEIKINATRDKYRVTATRGSLIYFSIVELSLIDPMYQNSLSYVKKLFNEAIRSV
jgi:dynein heavy chain